MKYINYLILTLKYRVSHTLYQSQQNIPITNPIILFLIINLVKHLTKTITVHFTFLKSKQKCLYLYYEYVYKKIQRHSPRFYFGT